MSNSEASLRKGARRAAKTWLATVLLCGVFSYFGMSPDLDVGNSEDRPWVHALIGMFFASWTLALLTGLIAFLSGALPRLKATVSIVLLLTTIVGWILWMAEPFDPLGTSEGVVVEMKVKESNSICIVETASGETFDVICQVFGNPLGVPEKGDKIRFDIRKAVVTGRRVYRFDEYVAKNGAPPEPLAFEAALRVGSEAGWRAFLRSYRESAYTAAARLELAALSQARPRPQPGSTDAGGIAPTPKAAGGSILPELPAGKVFRDCEDCPEMVRVPPGRFEMGNPSDEGPRADFEGPVHEVGIEYPLAVGKFEVTRGEFRRFVESTGYRPTNWCYTYERGEWEERAGRTWLDPGYVQNDSHPVVCVDWVDAVAYTLWLSRKTGESYRLLSSAEFEYVNRAGSLGRYPWGDGEDAGCRYANLADQTAKAKYADWTTHYCDDGNLNTAPVGRYQPNGFGLFDLTGNVWEWTQDCYHDNYSGAPDDGSAWTSGDCARRVARGASWTNPPASMRVAIHSSSRARMALSSKGFRLARTE